MSTQAIHVLYIPVGEEPQLKKVENTLNYFQKLIGGCIEVTSLGDKLLLICDEEGKMKGLEPNILIPQDVIVGNVMIVKDTRTGDFGSIKEKEIDKILTKFKLVR